MDSMAPIPAMMNEAVISRAARQVQACKTILLVEDETFVREMIYGILEDAGYRVLKCADAKLAKAVFHQYADVVGLVITDIVLPGENGRELARDLMELDSELKVILISGYPEKLNEEQVSAGDRVFYLPKPFSSESLVRKVWHATSAAVGEIAI